MNAHLINLSQFLSSYSNQNMKLNPDAASTLSSVTMMFFKQVLISIKTELDDKKEIFQRKMMVAKQANVFIKVL